MLALKRKIKESYFGNNNDFKVIKYIEVKLPLVSAHRNHIVCPDDAKVKNLYGKVRNFKLFCLYNSKTLMIFANS